MNEAERYVRQATRGLWGRVRQDARAELRGAVEDKVYRLRLLGLSEAEATRAALRDLGSPGAIARDLNRVHTLPHSARAALLAGVAALLGVRALAGVPVVGAASSLPLPSCHLEAAAADALLQKLPAAERARFQAELAKPGGRERLETECLKNALPPNDLLKLSDLLSALRAGGVDTRILEGTDAFLYLRFPGETEVQRLNLNDSIRQIGGETYVPVGNLLGQLQASVTAPLRLTGLINPTLNIGRAQMQLGTERHPIYSSNLYSWVVWDGLADLLWSDAPNSSELRKMVYFAENGEADTPALSLPVTGPEGTMYAIIYGRSAGAGSAPGASIRASRGGQVIFPNVEWGGKQPTVPRVVRSPAEFFKARAGGQAVALLYRLDTTDLRKLGLTPVPAAQVHLIPGR